MTQRQPVAGQDDKTVPSGRGGIHDDRGTDGQDLPGAAEDVAADPSCLQALLIESRQRWRDFALLGADLVFETDAAGRFTFLAPDPVLGFTVGEWLGRPAAWLLAQAAPDPFAVTAPVRDLRAWLRRAAGDAACLSFTISPLGAPHSPGELTGLRGAARDVTAEAEEADAKAAILRRTQAVERLVRHARRQVLAPQMLAATLEALSTGLGCAGSAVLDYGEGERARVLRQHGACPLALLDRLTAQRPVAPQHFIGPGGEQVALLPQARRYALLAWRPAEEPGFDADEREVLASVADMVFVALGNLLLQEELERQARTDPLTGLVNRRAFLAALQPLLAAPAEGPGHATGALLFLDLDHFKPINDVLGHEAGDRALMRIADLLRGAVRRTDIAARLGGDEFALWLPSADRRAAERRAARLCADIAALAPTETAVTPPLGVSIGIALRRDGVVETPAAMLARADAAMYVAKRGGRSHWAVAAEVAPQPATPAWAAAGQR